MNGIILKDCILLWLGDWATQLLSCKKELSDAQERSWNGTTHKHTHTHYHNQNPSQSVTHYQPTKSVIILVHLFVLIRH